MSSVPITVAVATTSGGPFGCAAGGVLAAVPAAVGIASFGVNGAWNNGDGWKGFVDFGYSGTRRRELSVQSTAVCETIVPSTLRRFLVQQVRWKKSWRRESIAVSRMATRSGWGRSRSRLTK